MPHGQRVTSLTCRGLGRVAAAGEAWCHGHGRSGWLHRLACSCCPYARATCCVATCCVGWLRDGGGGWPIILCIKCIIRLHQPHTLAPTHSCCIRLIVLDRASYMRLTSFIESIKLSSLYQVSISLIAHECGPVHFSRPVWPHMGWGCPACHRAHPGLRLGPGTGRVCWWGCPAGLP